MLRALFILSDCIAFTSLNSFPLFALKTMAPKALAFLLATFLLLTAKVSSSGEKQINKIKFPAITDGLQEWDPAHGPARPPAPEKPPVSPPPQPPAKPPTAPLMPPVKSKADCIPLCEQRCGLHSRKRLCMRACMTCCDRCRCVPPGTYGNREMCGKCYTDMVTHGNRTKCP